MTHLGSHHRDRSSISIQPFARRQLLALAALPVVAAMAPEAFAQVTIGRNITGTSINDVGGIIPPDSMGAVGIDHYTEFINGRFRVYRKGGLNVPLLTLTDGQFWNNAGVAVSGLSDPRILFDHRSARWFAIEGVFGGSLGVNVAVSQTSSPVGPWTGFFIDPNGFLNDFPRLGLNADGVFITTRDFSGGPTNTEAIISIPKADLLAPVPTIANRTVIPSASEFQIGYITQPIVNFGPSTGREPLLAPSNQFFSQLIRSNLNNVAGPGAATLSAGDATIFTPPTSFPPQGPQPDFTQDVDTGDDRFSGNVYQVGDILWAAHAINIGGLPSVQWYKIRESDNFLLQSGTISDTSFGFYFPSICANDNGDVVIGFSRSGFFAGGFISSAAAVGSTTGGITTFAAPIVLQAGAGNYHVVGGGRNRWGDYSAVTPDPCDPNIFWTTQEYASATNTWTLKHTEIIVPRPGEVRWLVAGSSTWNNSGSWIGGAVPSAGSHAIFSRATDPAGTGTFTVTAGGTIDVDRLSFRQGRMILDLGAGVMNVNNASAATPSLMVAEFLSNPIVTLRNGTLNTRHASMAVNSLATTTVNLTNLTWTATGDVTVGGTASATGGAATLNVGQGGAASVNVSGALRVLNSASVNFSDGAMSTGPLIVQGGRVNVTTGTTKLLRTTDVQTSAGGKVDLTTNAMTVNYPPTEGTPLIDVKNQILSAYAGGAWTGPGITTTNGNSSTHGLGYGEAADLTTVPAIFGTVDSTTILVRYTRYGDADLNAIVNLEDFNRLASNFGQSNRFWTQGDFNYNMIVNLDDFNLLAANFGLSASSEGPTPQEWANLAAAVPEPAGIALGSLGVMYLFRRRRRG